MDYEHASHTQGPAPELDPAQAGLLARVREVQQDERFMLLVRETVKDDRAVLDILADL